MHISFILVGTPGNFPCAVLCMWQIKQSGEIKSIKHMYKYPLFTIIDKIFPVFMLQFHAARELLHFH